MSMIAPYQEVVLQNSVVSQKGNDMPCNMHWIFFLCFGASIQSRWYSRWSILNWDIANVLTLRATGHRGLARSGYCLRPDTKTQTSWAYIDAWIFVECSRETSIFPRKSKVGLETPSSGTSLDIFKRSVPLVSVEIYIVVFSTYFAIDTIILPRIPLSSWARMTATCLIEPKACLR